MTFDTPEITHKLDASEAAALESIKYIAGLMRAADDRVEALLLAASLSKIAAVAAQARERILNEFAWQPPVFVEEVEQKSAQKRRNESVA